MGVPDGSSFPLFSLSLTSLYYPHLLRFLLILLLYLLVIILFSSVV